MTICLAPFLMMSFKDLAEVIALTAARAVMTLSMAETVTTASLLFHQASVRTALLVALAVTLIISSSMVIPVCLPMSLLTLWSAQMATFSTLSAA